MFIFDIGGRIIFVKKQSKVDLLNGPIWIQILLFFFPIMLGTFFQQLYNTVDAIVVGNFVGKQALAAVGGSTGTLINLLINFISGLAGGATVVIAQCYGKKDENGISKGIKSGMFLGISLGFVLMILGIAFARALLEWMDVTSDILPFAVIYMRIYLLGLIPTMIYNVGSGALRAMGDSKKPLYFLVISCFVNIVLDILLVCVVGMGVEGAAIATICSQLVSCALVLIVLGKKDTFYHYDIRDLSFDKDYLKQIVIIGLPTGIQSVLYSISNLFINAQVNSYGTDTIAAFTAFGKIDALFWMVSGAYSVALITVVGQCFGARKIDRMKKAVRTCILLYCITSALIIGVCYFGGQYLYQLFTSDKGVIEIGMDILKFLCPYWITFALIEIYSSTIRACGESLKPMIITALGICGLRIIWICFYPSNSVIETLYCYPISWIVTSIIFLFYYLKGSWLKRALNSVK